MHYAVVIERGPMSCGSQVPEMGGCVAIGETNAGLRRLIRVAIDFYAAEPEDDGRRVPTPKAHEIVKESTT